MAGHFQHVLATSDLTRFVPFAIFVCIISFVIFIILLTSSLVLRERNPISTRIELGCLGFSGFLWLVLGVFLATSDSGDADVECFASSSDVVPLDASVASFQTEQYQAMYRVLMTFSLINAILILLAFFTLLFLAIRRHRMGDEHMWYGPVTSCAWFNDYANSKPILPTRQNGRGAKANTSAGADRYTGVPHRHAKHMRGRSGQQGHWSEKTLAVPRRAQHFRNSSGVGSFIGTSISSHDLDNGKMFNPNKPRRMK